MEEKSLERTCWQWSTNSYGYVLGSPVPRDYDSACVAPTQATLNPGDILVGVAGGNNLGTPLPAVIRIDPRTGEQTVFSSGGPNGLRNGLAFEADGSIIIAEDDVFHRGEVLRVNPTTGAQTVVAINGVFFNPYGIGVEADGNILVSDTPIAPCGCSTVGAVIRVEPTTGTQTLLSSGGYLNNPKGMTVEADGNILVADLGTFESAASNAKLIRIDPTTAAQTLVSSHGLLTSPYGVAVEADGNILIVDADAFSGYGAILRANPGTGGQTPVSYKGFFIDPVSIALEADGNILVLDRFAASGAVIRVDPKTGTQTIVSSGLNVVRTGGSTSRPSGMAVVPSR